MLVKKQRHRLRKYYFYFVQVQYLSAGLPLPVTVTTEKRRSSRVTIRSGEVLIQLPQFLSKNQREENIEQLIGWARKKLQQLKLPVQRSDEFYLSGGEIMLLDEKFMLKIEPSKDAFVYSRLVKSDRRVEIYIPEKTVFEERKQTIKKALSRIFAKYAQPVVEQRIRELNATHFRKNIEKISLRYNHTRWGSCSSNGNISISTRLLMAPAFVRDYVYIHEIAHLFEMNHSHKFWKIVAHAMPDYGKAEQWLDTQGLSCDF
ncbi:MAG: M48 family metallopeptidase [Chitinophagales bacterium]|nr:M48 family metallopeptidase [Chitinophagales bacterium]